MAITSVEKSKYIAHQQDYLSEVKVGQYSKFLDKNPLFVTYYAINVAQSTVDAGIGNVHNYIGPRSPMRYNRVKEVPVYNIPELRPDVVTDEGGYDINMPLSGIAFLTATLRPKPGDIMLVEISGVKPLLFQCTDFQHTSILSNAIYTADFELLEIDQDFIQSIDNQVVEKLICKFENIGTNNTVIVTEEDDGLTTEITELADILTEYYTSAFYNDEVDGFVCYRGNEFGTQWYHDIYVTRFINESGIYTNDYSDMTVTLPYLELLPLNFDMLFKRSLFNAVLLQDKRFLYQFMYAWDALIMNITSPLTMASIPCLHPHLEMPDKYCYTPEKPSPDVADLSYQAGRYCGWDMAEPNFRPQFNIKLIESILTNVKSPDLNEVESIIYQYVTGGTTKTQFLNTDLIKAAFNTDRFTYMHMPIIIYILRQVATALSETE